MSPMSTDGYDLSIGRSIDFDGFKDYFSGFLFRLVTIHKAAGEIS